MQLIIRRTNWILATPEHKAQELRLKLSMSTDVLQSLIHNPSVSAAAALSIQGIGDGAGEHAALSQQRFYNKASILVLSQRGQLVGSEERIGEGRLVINGAGLQRFFNDAAAVLVLCERRRVVMENAGHLAALLGKPELQNVLYHVVGINVFAELSCIVQNLAKHLSLAVAHTMLEQSAEEAAAKAVPGHLTAPAGQLLNHKA